MKINLYDTNGNDYGSWTDTMDKVEIYAGATIEGLANERGIQITVHGDPKIIETRNDGLNILVIHAFSFSRQ
jgi:hypothetical protein